MFAPGIFSYFRPPGVRLPISAMPTHGRNERFGPAICGQVPAAPCPYWAKNPSLFAGALVYRAVTVFAGVRRGDADRPYTCRRFPGSDVNMRSHHTAPLFNGSGRSLWPKADFCGGRQGKGHTHPPFHHLLRPHQQGQGEGPQGHPHPYKLVIEYLPGVAGWGLQNPGRTACSAGAAGWALAR